MFHDASIEDLSNSMSGDGLRRIVGKLELEANVTLLKYKAGARGKVSDSKSFSRDFISRVRRTGAGICS